LFSECQAVAVSGQFDAQVLSEQANAGSLVKLIEK
jgi:hypothetical protein